MNKFDGKVVLITGGAAGIGAATAKLLSSQGATVAVADRDIARARSVVSELAGKGLAIEFDATDEQSINDAVVRTIDELGGVDILHNNVGVTTAAWKDDKEVLNTPVEVWDMIFSVNVRSHFLATKAVLPHMIEKKQGAIVNMASVGGMRGGSSLVSYGVSKAAVAHLTLCTAVQYGRYGIRTNCIAPGVIKTQQLLDAVPDLEAATLDTLPFPRVGVAEDIASLVSFLASDEASFINGEVVRADGGGIAGLAPRLSDQ